MGALQVEVMRLTECLVSPGWRLIFDEMNAPALHYTLAGTGRLLLDGSPPIELSPHKLVVLPPRTMFSFEAAVEDGDGPSQVMDARPAMRAEKTIHRIVAGSGEPKLVMVCGYFRALYGSSVEIFSFLAEPIVENFDQADQVEARLRATLAEVAFRQVGSDVMTTTLLKQVMIALFRKSLTSSRLWTERLSLLGDPPIARAFAEMTARPGAAHDVETLARVAGLSRSAFMDRFKRLFGESPMAALRDLRLRHAATQIGTGHLSVDQAAHDAGYSDRSSFARAFRKLHGCQPSEYKERLSR